MNKTKLIINIIYFSLIISIMWIYRDFFSLLLIIGLIGLIGFLLINFLSGNSKKQKEDIPILTKEKEEHYQETGMSSNEIDFFRKTMASSKTQILLLEKNMNSVAKLKAINLRNDTVKAAKAIFKELVNEPKKLHQADTFLYTHLPNILDLTKKYIEINQHDIKNKQTYEALEECASVINDMSRLIVSDYQQFVSDDLEDLDIEISIAKQSLTRDNKHVDKLTKVDHEEEQ